MSNEAVEKTIDRYLKLGIPSISLVVLRHGQPAMEIAAGRPDPAQADVRTTAATRYDLASVTKLFTATAFMALAGRGDLALDQPVASVLPGFSGIRPICPYEDPLNWNGTVTVQSGGGDVDAGTITFRQLLAHRSGLPAWRPLFRQPSTETAREMTLNTFFSYRPDSDSVYSDLGLILTGLAIERVTGLRLDDALYELVLGPLRLRETGYLPVDQGAPTEGSFAATEYCQWRQRRIVGEVHDENAWRLNGVAGHAGLFSTATDLACFGLMFLQGGQPVLTPEQVREMTMPNTIAGDTRRGIGFQLWSPDPEASSNPLSETSYGHTGFTGTSLWIDPQRAAVIALLSNEVYNGRTDRLTLPFRVDMHRAIVQVLDASE